MEAIPQQQPALLLSVARGDVSAFEQIYDRDSAVLYGILLRILHNPEDAQEVLQEAFVQIWNRAAMYDPARGGELAWLISIARSRAIDRLRSRTIRTTRETEAGIEISHNPANVEEDGATRAIGAQQRTQVREALAALPEAQRKALEMAYFEGLSQSEIASRLSEPLGTVKTRMQLGMKKLRERLKSVL